MTREEAKHVLACYCVATFGRLGYPGQLNIRDYADAGRQAEKLLNEVLETSGWRVRYAGDGPRLFVARNDTHPIERRDRAWKEREFLTQEDAERGFFLYEVME